MCNDCFTNEYKSFQSEDEWLAFDLELTKKLGQGKVVHVEFIGDGIRDKDDGEYIYQCQSCNQKWKLKDPDHAWRGYFLRA